MRPASTRPPGRVVSECPGEARRASGAMAASLCPVPNGAEEGDFGRSGEHPVSEEECAGCLLDELEQKDSIRDITGQSTRSI